MPILHWLDRDKTIKQTSRAPYRLLEIDPKFSCGDRNSQNLLIQGDNLEALKALLPYYAGKVKCIFIDPPYNTKSAFEHYDDNLEHTKWLEMMYPRLELLAELLSDDGVIFISINDDQVHYLKVILDEIFGRKNFCGSFVWEKKKKPSFLNSNMGSVTEYILSYAKNRINSPAFIGGVTTAGKKYPLNNAGNSIQILTFPANSVEFLCEDQIFEPQDMSSGNIKTKLLDRLEVKDGRNKDLFRLEGEWRYSQKKLSEILSNKERIVISKAPFRPNHIKEGGEPKKIKNLLSIAHYNMSTYEDAAEEGSLLFGHDNSFDYPKPEKLIGTLIGSSTKEGDLVLDSFLGSGTTAAVAHKMNRHWIGIEMGEHAKTHCAVRLQQVIDGEQGGISRDVNWQGGGGLRFYNLGEAIFDEDGQINKNIRFEHLAAHIWFSETKTPFGQKEKSPLLGIHEGVAYYLLFNGILGDKSISGGNVLTSKILSALPNFNGPKVIYGETSRLGLSKLEDNQITFKQTPYDIKAR
ncbi:hypothetical protein LBMAG18_12840 [Alphaproteobacteria bacterium]|nr:hypothetical protein LBMAG18_12840 [Alphaproteobacteria bacterium]